MFFGNFYEKNVIRRLIFCVMYVTKYQVFQRLGNSGVGDGSLKVM